MAEAQAAAPNASSNAARSAGRGGLAIAAAKVSFILFGFVQQIALPYVLGDAGYGAISKVFAVVGIVNNVIVAVSLQGVSRTVAAAVDDDTANKAFRRVLTIHVALAAVVALGFAVAAGFIADSMKSSHIAVPLRVAGVVILLYGTYAPIVGSLNGRQRFADQAGLDILYGAMRAVLTLVVAWLFLRATGAGVLGAALGFALTATLIIPVALWRAGTGRPGGTRPTLAEYAAFLGPLALGQVFLNLLLQTDFLLLSRFVGAAAEATGRTAEDADALIGVYRGTQLFSFLPYQMLMSVTFVLFPMLAKAHAERDTDAVARYTRTGLRLALVIAGLMAGTVSALGPLALTFAFPADFGPRGGEALRLLSLGMGAFAILGVTSAALTSCKKESWAAGLTIAAVLLVAAGCSVLVPGAEWGPAMLVRSAIGTAGGLLVVTVVAAFAIRRVTGAFAPARSLVRVGIAVAILQLVGRLLPNWGRLFVLVEAAGLAALYVAVLVVLRELRGEDLDMVRQTLGRKR